MVALILSILIMIGLAAVIFGLAMLPRAIALVALLVMAFAIIVVWRYTGLVDDR